MSEHTPLHAGIRHHLFDVLGHLRGLAKDGALQR